MSLKLTPGQLREVVGLSQDAFRHWKRALAPLAGRNGYRPCFTSGDLFAVAVIKVLITEAGIRVGAVGGIAEELFRFANATPWATIERSTFIFDLSAGKIAVIPEANSIRTTGTAVHVACRPIVARLRERLLADQATDPQQMLQLPPTIVSARTGTGGDQA